MQDVLSTIKALHVVQENYDYTLKLRDLFARFVLKDVSPCSLKSAGLILNLRSRVVINNLLCSPAP